MSQTLLGCICTGVTLAYAMLLILAISLPSWYTAKNEDATAKAGLFKECVDLPPVGEICYSLKTSQIPG